MISRFGFVFFFVALVSLGLRAQDTDLDVADANIVRLSPDSFPQLPQNIRTYLKSAGYTIPQSYLVTARPHNVISGNFSGTGQTDWAVLASRDRVSGILVFWNGSLEEISLLAKESDKNYLQRTENDAILFSRYIETIGAAAAKQYAKGNRKKEKTAIADHDGIFDRNLNEAASLHYYGGGNWYNYHGADDRE